MWSSSLEDIVDRLVIIVSFTVYVCWGEFKLHISDFGRDFEYFTVTSLHILWARSTNKLPSPPSSFYGDKNSRILVAPHTTLPPRSASGGLTRKIHQLYFGCKKSKHSNEARMWNLCCLCQIWITSSAHQCLLLLLYMVGWTDDGLWIRGVMSCIVAPHVGATLSDRQMWPYSFRVIRLDR